MPELPHVDGSCRWNAPQRIAFRFVFAYTLLFLTTYPLHHLPGLEQVLVIGTPGWNLIVPWVGRLVFGLEITPEPMSGGGDSLFNNVMTLCCAVFAAAAAVVWSVIDHQRPAYPRLHKVLRVFVRYALALTVLGYGFHKVFNTQFPYPGLDRMIQTYGDSSPSGLLWTFMGFSPAYTFISGAAEVVGGALLLCRRTTTLGALILMGVMANVVALNFCYDVGVKLFSMHMLAMAALLAAPDLSRLADVLVLNGTVPARETTRRGWPARGAMLSGTIIAGTYVFLGSGWHNYQQWRFWDADLPLEGLYEVEAFTKDGVEVPPMLTEADRWRRVVVNPVHFAVQTLDGRVRRYYLSMDDVGKTLWLYPYYGMAAIKLDYAEAEPGVLTIEGEYDGLAISARIKRVEEPSFKLTSRGFHWIGDEAWFNQ